MPSGSSRPAENRVWRIDPRTNAVVASIDIGINSSNLLATPNAIWVVSDSNVHGSHIKSQPRNQSSQTFSSGHPLGGGTTDGINKSGSPSLADRSNWRPDAAAWRHAENPAGNAFRAIRARPSQAIAETTLRELGRPSLSELLELTLLIAEKDPRRYPRVSSVGAGGSASSNTGDDSMMWRSLSPVSQGGGGADQRACCVGPWGHGREGLRVLGAPSS